MRNRSGVLGLLGAGALCAVGARLLRDVAGRGAPSQGSDARVSVWAADRDAGAVYGLDDDLIVVRRVRLRWPVAVSACSDGGAWALGSADGTPEGASRLVRIAPEGRIVFQVSLGCCLELDQLDDGSAVVLERRGDPGEPCRILRCDGSGNSRDLVRGDGFTCIAASDGSVAVGTSEGEVLRIALDGTGTVLDRLQLESRVVDLASGPSIGSLWALAGAERKRVHLLEGNLRVRWSADAGSERVCIAPVPGEERVWLVEEPTSFARRLGKDGATEIELTDLPLQGLAPVASYSDGGVLIAAPGAILRRDRTGRLETGQGGFACLVDLDRVPRAKE